MSLNRAKKLREERAKLIADAREIFDSIDDKTGEADAKEKEQRFDDLMEQADNKLAEAVRHEKLHDAEKSLEEPADERQAGREDGTATQEETSADETREQDYAQAFSAWCRGGHEVLSSEQRGVLQSGFQTINPDEIRAQGVTTPAAGGYTVPEGFQNNLERAMLAFGGMREAGDPMPTETGNDLPWPTTNDTNQKGELIGENTAHNEQDVAFGQVIFNSYTYSSKIIRVSLQLMQDGAFNLDQLLPDMMGERIARITNEHFTTGTGTAQPNGVVTAASAGHTAAANNAISYDDLVELEHSVDPAYRRNPGTRFMFNDSTLKILKKLKDTQGRPLWLPGLAVREPDTILQYPYTINQDVANVGSSAISALFGDLKKYKIRDVRGVTVLRLVERYAEFLQIGFLAFSRHDGELVDAGTNPVKLLTHPV